VRKHRRMPDGIFSNQKSHFWVNFGGYCNGRCWYLCFMDIWSILRSFEIFYDLLVYFVLIWYIFPRFGMLCLEKSGNPGSHTHQVCPSLLREHWSRFDSRKYVHTYYWLWWKQKFVSRIWSGNFECSVYCQSLIVPGVRAGSCVHVPT
jgi:hypothetical protein